MRYVKEENRHRIHGVDAVGNIHVSGSVLGMQQRYGWPKGGQVRVGQWIYNVGPSEVSRLRSVMIIAEPWEPLEIAKMRVKLQPGYRLSAHKKAELKARIAAWERDNEKHP